MKTDLKLKQDILAELEYEPSVNAADIGVLVKDGSVTLNGFVRTFGEKWDAVSVAKRVAGVKAVADDITVRLPNSHFRTDGEIAADAASAIGLSSLIPKGAVDVTVRQGWVTLAGSVEWWYQKEAAQEVVRNVTGVKGISNGITITPKQATSSDVSTAIKTAFERHALLDSDKITVETSGSKVVLHGVLDNCLEREEAERAAWSAPGVSEVQNNIVIHLW